MKALVIKEPGRALVERIPERTADAKNLLLQVKMVGLCGSDLNSFRGKNPMVSFPRIPGHEVAATIMGGSTAHPSLAVGVNVTLSPYTNCGRCASCLRDRPNACQFNQTLGVQRDGALTEFISMPPEKLFPANLSIQELRLVEPLTVGFHAITRGRVTSADTVAVFGCGGVGLGAIAAARFRGATVIGIDVDDLKLQIARSAGAQHSMHTARESLHERFLEFSSGPDVIVEAIGLPETFRSAVEEVAFTGRLVYIGYAKEPVSYETRLFVQKELDILGSRNALPEDFVEVIRMLEDHRFPVEDAVSSIVTLDEAPGVLDAWSANPAGFTRIMVRLE